LCAGLLFISGGMCSQSKNLKEKQIQVLNSEEFFPRFHFCQFYLLNINLDHATIMYKR